MENAMNDSYHQFIKDENKMLRESLLTALKEKQSLLEDLLEVRDLLVWHEQKALPFKGFGAVVHQSTQEEAHA
jgi:hypothetical protein